MAHLIKTVLICLIIGVGYMVIVNLINTPKNSVITDEVINDETSKTISLDQANIDKVYVDKSAQRLYLMQGKTAIKSYHIALGDEPKGHKRQEGDERTPEGEYILDYKNEDSIAYRSIHVSYPNEQDVAHANELGVSPGGAIMIHGQMNGAESLTNIMQQRNWTNGCMAVSNEEMDEIMSAVKVGTSIEIVW